MPDVLFNMAESLRQRDNPESAIWYSRIITDYPFSAHVADAKAHLTEMNRPIPEPNPAAVARGPQIKEEKGMMGKVFGILNHRPAVSTDTGASSVKDSNQGNPDDKSKDGDSGVGGTFKIENKPVKKPK
jgi:hypothetical protein